MPLALPPLPRAVRAARAHRAAPLTRLRPLLASVFASSLAIAAAGGGCGGRSPSGGAGESGGDSAPAPTPLGNGRALSPRTATGGVAGAPEPARPPRAPRVDPDALPPAALDLPAERRVLQVSGGAERTVDAEAARARGLTVVDLSDDWAPALFADGVGPGGVPLPNRYRAVFVGLANDRTDGDGQPLGRGERNYLELYGVPPSLSVLRARFLEDAAPARACADVDLRRLLAVRAITTWGATSESRELTNHERRAARLEAARAAAGAGDLQALAGRDPRLARDVQAHLRQVAERAAFAEVEKRVVCEGLLDPARHRAGRYDSAMRAAVFSFQQRHAVLEQGDLGRATLEAMARPPLAHDWLALRRVLEERVVHAAGIIEDGSAPAPAPAPASATAPAPASAPAPATAAPGDAGSPSSTVDLVGPATQAVLDALDLTTPEEALAFFRRHPPADFQRLSVAARLPPLPLYYGREMDLSVQIDRGDVWYDFPFDTKGQRLPQPRERFPALTLYTKWQGRRLPLCRWRTTVGGWRAEMASDGQEYYAYKGSDVGPRVWRHIVAAPVWIPPPSSPLGSMVKEKRVNGAFVRVTNYDETGPGYLSAYGLAAAIHVQMRKGEGGVATYFDNGIRTHGSFDYLSLRGRFSHGCHRLQNNLAVRLFSFVLAHRRARVLGSQAAGFRRQFWAAGEMFDLRLPSRGFYYELDPPLPVETLEGRIQGVRQTSVTGYVPKPGVRYAVGKPPPPPTDTPESKAAGGSEP